MFVSGTFVLTDFIYLHSVLIVRCCSKMFSLFSCNSIIPQHC